LRYRLTALPSGLTSEVSAADALAVVRPLPDGSHTVEVVAVGPGGTSAAARSNVVEVGRPTRVVVEPGPTEVTRDGAGTFDLSFRAPAWTPVTARATTANVSVTAHARAGADGTGTVRLDLRRFAQPAVLVFVDPVDGGAGPRLELRGPGSPGTTLTTFPQGPVGAAAARAVVVGVRALGAQGVGVLVTDRSGATVRAESAPGTDDWHTSLDVTPLADGPLVVEPLSRRDGVRDATASAVIPLDTVAPVVRGTTTAPARAAQGLARRAAARDHRAGQRGGSRGAGRVGTPARAAAAPRWRRRAVDPARPDRLRWRRPGRAVRPRRRRQRRSDGPEHDPGCRQRADADPDADSHARAHPHAHAHPDPDAHRHDAPCVGAAARQQPAGDRPGGEHDGRLP
jgi:hypothetical protein